MENIKSYIQFLSASRLEPVIQRALGATDVLRKLYVGITDGDNNVAEFGSGKLILQAILAKRADEPISNTSGADEPVCQVGADICCAGIACKFDEPMNIYDTVLRRLKDGYLGDDVKVTALILYEY